MATKTKYSKPAKAIFDLYQSMPEKVQRQIEEMITKKNTDYDLPESAELTGLSDQSLKEIWETPENDHWDDFFESKGYV